MTTYSAGFSASAIFKIPASFFPSFSDMWSSFRVPGRSHIDGASSTVEEEISPDCLSCCAWGRFDQSEADRCDHSILNDHQFWEVTNDRDTFPPIGKQVQTSPSYIHHRTRFAVCHSLFLFERVHYQFLRRTVAAHTTITVMKIEQIHSVVKDRVSEREILLILLSFFSKNVHTTNSYSFLSLW